MTEDQQTSNFRVASRSQTKILRIMVMEGFFFVQGVGGGGGLNLFIVERFVL